MKDEWISRLSKPYTALEAVAPGRIPRALGLDLPNVEALIGAVFNDLDPDVLGIGWWRDVVDTKRRILIGDHLLQLTGGISRNLIEARLHQLELEDCLARESAQVNDTMLSGAGTPGVFGPASDALGEMWGPLGDLHIVGFLRAIGSAFDCLGTAAIAIVGLPTPLFRSGWARFRHALDNRLPLDETPQAALYPQIRRVVDSAIESAGPRGWLDWTIEARNMLVHRPRRVNMRVLEFVGRPILLPRGAYQRVEMHATLWRDPARSEVEALRDGSHSDLTSIVLIESAVRTVDGIASSARSAIEAICGVLLETWAMRRSAPRLIVQPAASQWADPDKESTLFFDGYAPGSVSTEGLERLVQHPSDATRMAAADLLGEARTWRTT